MEKEGEGEGEGEGESTRKITEIESNTRCLNSSILFHVIKGVLGFILFMHQQIPSILQDVCVDFDSLQLQYKDLETAVAKSEVKPNVRRNHLGRMREVKLGIKRLHKFMDTVTSLDNALKMMISEVHNVQELVFILGPSPLRPQWAYELRFVHDNMDQGTGSHFGESRVADTISKKVIRALLLKNAGSGSYPGPTKLFLLVKAPSSFSLPLHFLPKRDFKYSKKIVPYILQVKCRSQGPGAVSGCTEQSGSFMNLNDSTSNDLIWFQCRHVVKGLVFKVPEED